METNFTEEQRYYHAKKKVDSVKGFYHHLITYIVFNIFFLVFNLITSPNELWFYWPLLWWGVGVTSHGTRVFGYYPFFSKDWEERKIKDLMDKENKSKQSWS
jgi:hypothetical protein